MKTLNKESYTITPKPEMDPAQQKIVSAGYPDELKFFLMRFQACAHSPKELEDLKSLFLLYGHPGGGKKSAARLIAMILDRPLLEIRCPGVQAERYGSAAKNLEISLRPILDSFYPWVVCLSELDARQIAILQLLKNGGVNPNVILIGTSNFKQDIPRSVLSRIGIGAIHIPLPNHSERIKMAESKHFWPTITAGTALYNSALATTTSIHGMHASSSQLDIARASLQLQTSSESKTEQWCNLL